MAAEEKEWEFPPELRPVQAEFAFKLDPALTSVVGLRSEIPEDAFTAQILGTERLGNGVVISDDGLVLTIGYLITEAQSVWLTTQGGDAVPGHALAYDQGTGVGLVQALGRLHVPSLKRGSASAVAVGDQVVVAGHGGPRHALKAQIVAKREFAGYWEYVLDEAIFTAPAHPHWGGAALIGRDGRLAGIGSLLVQERLGDKDVQGNMIVPIDILEPILGDLLAYGRVNKPARPWLGLYATEVKNYLVVAGLAKGGPAEKAGVQVGDVVLKVADAAANSLAELFRNVWKRGDAGVEVTLTVARGSDLREVTVRSADRNDFLKKPRLH